MDCRARGAAVTGRHRRTAAGVACRQGLRAHAQHRPAEAQVRASDERYRQVVENARDIIFAVDRGGYCTSMNRAGQIFTSAYVDDGIALHGAHTGDAVLLSTPDALAADVARVIAQAAASRVVEADRRTGPAKRSRHAVA